jgi:intein/homing endonuclease
MAKKPILKSSEDLNIKPRISEKINFKSRRFKFSERQKQFLDLALNDESKIIFLAGPAGTSKAQPISEPVLTPSGWKQMGSLKVGDKVCCPDGESSTILEIHEQGVKDVYKITFQDGSHTHCCIDHLWFTQTYNDRNATTKINSKKIKKPRAGSVKSLKEIIATLKNSNGKLNHYIPVTQAVNFEENSHVIHPYLMGILIGDGCLVQKVTFSTSDKEILNNFESKIPNGYSIVKQDSKYDFSIKGVGNKNIFLDEIRRLNLNTKSYTKFIPEEYLFDSIPNRIELLQGLMDSDGHVSSRSGSTILYTTVSEDLAKNVKNLVQSLGGVASIRSDRNYYTYKGVKKLGHVYFSLNISLPENITPFKLKRKLDKFKPRIKYFPRRIISEIELVKKEECQCILIDHQDHLYLTNDYIVTHNTYLSVYASLNILAKDQEKEMIYVRSIAESAEKGLGSLPGEAGHKFEPFVTPLWEKIDEMVSGEHAVWLKQSQRLTAKPINYLRGASWENKLIIADEAQNFSFKELVTLITRIGENTKIFICGDFMQADIKSSGFEQMFNIFNSADSIDQGIHCFQFGNEDIHRSMILRFIIQKLQEERRQRSNG